MLARDFVCGWTISPSPGTRITVPSIAIVPATSPIRGQSNASSSPMGQPNPDTASTMSMKSYFRASSEPARTPASGLLSPRSAPPWDGAAVSGPGSARAPGSPRSRRAGPRGRGFRSARPSHGELTCCPAAGGSPESTGRQGRAPCAAGLVATTNSLPAAAATAARGQSETAMLPPPQSFSSRRRSPDTCGVAPRCCATLHTATATSKAARTREPGKCHQRRRYCRSLRTIARPRKAPSITPGLGDVPMQSQLIGAGCTGAASAHLRLHIGVKRTDCLLAHGESQARHSLDGKPTE